jgi:hypothetical protein
MSSCFSKIFTRCNGYWVIEIRGLFHAQVQRVRLAERERGRPAEIGYGTKTWEAKSYSYWDGRRELALK